MPIGFQVGPLFIRFYGIILMFGAVVAAVVAEREARRRGLKSDLVWDGLIWVLIGGVIGARLWHVFTPMPTDIAQGTTTMYYLTHPISILTTWQGGLGIPGAVIGGGLALYMFCRRRGLIFAQWADIAAPALALGQAIGRWGNYINQELYGLPTNLPWAIFINPANRIPGLEDQAYYHPLFLYESVLNFMNFILLLFLGRRYAENLIPGDLFLLYLIAYPLERFFLDFLRLNASEIAGININQSLMLVIAVASAALLVYRRRKSMVTADQHPGG